MHEFGIIDGVIKVAESSAVQAHAVKVLKVSLKIGSMVEAQEDSLRFAYEVLTEDKPLLKGSELEIIEISPSSVCLDCNHHFEHSRFDLRCPKCNSAITNLLTGRELEIASLEVEMPEDKQADGVQATEDSLEAEQLAAGVPSAEQQPASQEDLKNKRED